MQRLGKAVDRTRAHTDVSILEFFLDSSEKALLSQVRWAKENLGVTYELYMNLLSIEQARFCNWVQGKATLTVGQRGTLAEVGMLQLHLLSVYGFNLDKVRTMCEYVVPDAVSSSFHAPPWTGTSINKYLLRHGKEGIKTIRDWFQALRFADPS